MLDKLFSDKEFSSARNFLYSSVVWLVVGVIAALILAVKFVIPDFLGTLPYLTFGRIRPIHVNLVLFGFLSMGNIGAMFYMIPRLTGAKLYSERLGNITMWVWNFIMLSAVITLTMGYTEGRELAELVWWQDWLVLLGLIAVAVNVFGTIYRRQEKQIYVSLWYFMGTLLWFPFVWIIGNHTFVHLTGLNDAAVNWFYGHNVLGLWFTTLGVGMTYYLIPIISRNPLFSHKLSLIGFWSIAMAYAPTGAHHLLQAPIPEWLKSTAIISSMCLLIPVAAAVTNFYMTMQGKWHVMLENMALRYTLTGVMFYIITCLQGPFQAARPVNWYLHFTFWVVGHAHVALLGTFGFMVWGATYHILPRILGHGWYSKTLANVHYWMTFLGFWGFFWSLTIGGLQQAAIWQMGVPINQGVLQLLPINVARLISGLIIVIGQLVYAYNVYRTAIARPKPAVTPEAVPAEAAAH